MKRKWLAITAVIMVLAFAACSQAAPPKNVSRTALSTMAFRAVGAQDTDPKTRNPDYLAVRLCPEAVIRDKMHLSMVWAKDKPLIDARGMWIIYQLTVRTKHIDATLAQAARDGVRQVVVLGAGFDTRAYRFHKEFPDLRFFEVDLPAMVAFKEKSIKKVLGDQAAQVVYVPIDFETQTLDQELAKAGFQKELKTLFIWEGVVYYLDEASVAGTFRSLAQNSAPGSLVIFDYIPPDAADGTTSDPYGKAVYKHVKSLGEPWRSGIEPTDMAAYLQKQGLELKSNRGPDYMLEHYLTGSDGKPGGTLPQFFWMATAMVPAR